MFFFSNFRMRLIVPFLVGITLLVGTSGCVNDLDSIRKVTFKATDPDERTRNLKVIYTDSGYARVQVFANLAETYSKPEAVTKLKEGVKVNFFNEKGEIVSVLTAMYGEIQQDKGTMFVRDSVRLFNYKKNQRLETEQLFWNQRDSSIYSENAVVVRTPEAVLFGQGIRTKQDFSYYEFLKPKGKISVQK
ncbi:MAG: LPS export ABC transporter periplasmic protein LptC [Crocinitomicaceae bacterium]|nr:MAG: LPS export ABC transporter periplasmic protein LptC [Crocinitomicaceae bacterium]